jgi:DNA-binding response OmpR family regulator
LLNTTRILIVDSNIDHATGFRAILQKNGCQVDAFVDPVEAIEAFSRQEYHIVILDIKLQGNSGFMIARKIHRANKQVKIILMSTFPISADELSNVTRFIRIDAVIKKPVGIAKLMDHLSVLSGHYKEGRWSKSSFVTTVGAAATAVVWTLLDDALPLLIN